MGQQCALHSLVSPLLGRWKAEIVFNLRETPLRISDLEQLIPDANPRVIKRQLRSLEANGIVQRTIYDEVPSKVEYSLTEHGKSLFPLLETLDKTINDYPGHNKN